MRTGKITPAAGPLLDAMDADHQASGAAAFADSTEWRFTLTPADGGTVIRQSFQVLSLPARRRRRSRIRDRAQGKIKIKDEAERAGQLPG